jgi:hypothetical protein
MSGEADEYASIFYNTFYERSADLMQKKNCAKGRENLPCVFIVNSASVIFMFRLFTVTPCTIVYGEIIVLVEIFESEILADIVKP